MNKVRNGFLGLGVAALAAMLAQSAVADDWVAVKLRGVVLQLVDGAWVELNRGDVVPDDRVVRTLRTGRVTFTRDQEVIDLGANTQVQIFDRQGRSSFTTVKQYFGTVSVEAEAQNVQHFAVQAPQLAAVVKGTKFTVIAGKRTSRVAVERGAVAVVDRDTQQSTLVAAGQSASTSDGAPLKVSGTGTLPVIHDDAGAALTELVGTAGTNSSSQEAKASEKETKAAEKAAEKEAKAAEEAAEKESKAAEKEARAEEKAAERESGSSGSSGNGNSRSGDSGNSNGHSGSDNDNSGKGKKDKD